MADVKTDIKNELIGQYITWPNNGGNAFGHVYGGDSDSCAVNLPNGQICTLNSKTMSLAKIITKAEFEQLITATINELNKHLPTKGENMDSELKAKIDELQVALTSAQEALKASEAAKNEADASAKVVQSQVKEWEAKLTEATAKIAELEKSIAESNKAKDEAIAKIKDMEKCEKAKQRCAKMKECKAETLFGDSEEAILKAFAEMSDETFETAYKVAEAGAKKLTEVTVTSLPKLTEQTQTNDTKLTQAAEIVADAKVEADPSLASAATVIDNSDKELLAKFAGSKSKFSKNK